MRRVALFGLLLASLSLTFVAGLWAADLKEEFSKLVTKYDAALLTRDAKFFEDHFGEGHFVGPNGQLFDRKEYVAAALGRTWETVKASQEVVQELSDTVVIESGVFSATGKEANGKEFREHSRYLAVWVKKGGKWVNVAEQGTPIVEQSK